MTHCRQIMLEELQRRNFAPTTISTYLHAVEQFARHFKCRPDRLNQTHFRSYQAYLLRERKMQPLTVRLHVATLRFFFVKTLKRRYLLDDTPYPKAPRRLPQILSVEEVARLIDAAAQSVAPHDADGPLFDWHAERGTAPSAGRRHRQSTNADSHSTGKGGRNRYVPLSPTLLTTLREYLPVDATEDLALSWDGRRLARDKPTRPRSSGMPVSSRLVAPGSPSAVRRTSCAIRTPPTCSRVAPTSGRFSSFSATSRSGTRCCISICRGSTCKRSRVLWTH